MLNEDKRNRRCSRNKKINLIWIALWEWAIQLNYLLFLWLPFPQYENLDFQWRKGGWASPEWKQKKIKSSFLIWFWLNEGVSEAGWVGLVFLWWVMGGGTANGSAKGREPSQTTQPIEKRTKWKPINLSGSSLEEWMERIGWFSWSGAPSDSAVSEWTESAKPRKWSERSWWEWMGASCGAANNPIDFINCWRPPAMLPFHLSILMPPPFHCGNNKWKRLKRK